MLGLRQSPTLANLGHYAEAFATLVSAESVGRGEEVFARSRVPNTYGAFYADLGLWDEALDRDLAGPDGIELIGGAAAVQEPHIHTLLNLADDHLALGVIDSAVQAISCFAPDYRDEAPARRGESVQSW